MSAEVLLLSWMGVAASCAAWLPPAVDVSRLQTHGGGCRADLLALRNGLDSGEPWALTSELFTTFGGKIMHVMLRHPQWSSSI